AGNRLYGLDGNDYLKGGSGVDLLDGGSGIDNLSGGEGADIFRYSSISDAPTGGSLERITDFEAGTDKIDLSNLAIQHIEIVSTASGPVLRVVGSGGEMQILVNGSGEFSLSDAIYELISFEGGPGQDAITGSPFDDVINGYGDNDFLSGIDGNDILDGGTGDDEMHGGLGDDTFYIDSRDDVVVELAGEGFDTVFVNFDLKANRLDWLNIEGFGLTGTASNLTGNNDANALTANANLASRLAGKNGDDTLFGGNFNDNLDGGSGADTMSGGLGDDIYNVDDLGDVVIENADQGTDLVRAKVDYTLPDNVENLRLQGAATTGFGNAL
ncbi:calcium-binding protein, partial [Erythrobacter alti]|uniref:calcium-binding protein n=1 Tax=Erythrobacter alti TaxID=1896145 RepID=UPI0030F40B5A